MGRRARSGRAVLHLCLMRLRIRNEFPEIVGRKVCARDQYLRRIGDQYDRRKIAGGIVNRSCIERLVLRMRADIPKHELIAVGYGSCDAGRASHPARTSDILDDDLLAEDVGGQWRKDSPKNVDPAAGPKRD